MNKLLTGLFVLALTSAVCAADEGPCLKDGDNIVLIGDSITEQGFRNSWGYYHVLTNAADEVAKAKGPKVNFIPLGYSGYQVKSWSDMERKSVTNDVWTWYRNPGWNLKDVFDGKVDVIVIFLGMNDILQPSMRDTDEDRARWLSDYKTFVNNLRERCHPRQFVFATITPLTADESSPKNRIRAKLNNALYALARSERAQVVGFGGVIEGGAWELARADSAYRMVPDDVHPNKVGHSLMAGALLDSFGLSEVAGGARFAYYDEHAKAVKRCAGKVNVGFSLVRTSQPTDEEFTYDLRSSIFSGRPPFPEVRVLPPKGWCVDEPFLVGDEGLFTLRGKPEKARTPVVVEAKWNDGTVSRTVFKIPAPWKLSEDGGEWKVYTATDDYTGGAKPGSIDPYQCFFGWQTNTLKAARRVWSEKERDVKAALSHQGFSETLDLTVAFDGKTVWTDKLDRNGRNHIEKTLHLKKGWNALEITCVHHDWQRQFSFDFEPLAGDDLSNLRYDLK